MRFALCVSAAALASCSPQAAPGAPAPEATEFGVPQFGLEQVKLTIISKGRTHRFTVEVARTPEQQQRGMMFRTAIGPNQGMLFPYKVPQSVSFWMRNTLIPLDIVFIGSDATIARIATTSPRSDKLVPSGEPVSAVLEIAGGRAAELGIAEGDRVEW